MRWARSVCDRPEKTIRRFCGPRSIQWLGDDCVTTAGSRPGRTSSGLAPTGCISLPVLLPRPCERKCFGRDVFRDNRTSGDPSPIPDLDGCDEAIVDTGPDVAADRRAALRRARLMREVGGDRACAHVRIVADVRIADVRQMRHFRAVADP